MTDITVKYTPLESLGYVTCNVPDDVMNVIRQEVQHIKDSNFHNAVPYNYTLAGQIQHEYGLKVCEPILTKFLKFILPEYWYLIGKHSEAQKEYVIRVKDDLPNLWVNFQKKYEVNPIHDHGGLLSFVIYLNIPYSLEDEFNQPHLINGNNPPGPAFSFIYPALYTRNRHSPVSTRQLQIDKSWENTIIIFPSWLQHSVNPFYTSDDYRISVAGNIVSVNNG